MKFGEFLVSKGYVTETQVDVALMIQRERMEKGQEHLRVGEILVALYALNHDTLKKALREYAEAGLTVG
ncbi:hypothetical protein [Spirochaeta thermophila]|uniref:Uncharacterized protein n=1 Tax=Winmispira thermophila (strain ATCC 49972 / DSM 6192 / RI 19.B1) TaxID=665571 RepID=E0RTS1_WINT6|nr:hypothetical protein [Spirochaeta thermophila]ADN02446.1 hypothetical protein STHERM_c15060 [Spirochaeta thermophila DSM 6192]